jgi:hypothetical protein
MVNNKNTNGNNNTIMIIIMIKISMIIIGGFDREKLLLGWGLGAQLGMLPSSSSCHLVCIYSYPWFVVGWTYTWRKYNKLADKEAK